MQTGTENPAHSAPQCTDTLVSLLHEQALKQPHAPAVLAPGRDPLSYAGLLAQVQRLGNHLHALGAAPATRVAVVLPNGPEMAVAFVGVAASAACAPLNPAYQAAEFRFHLQDTRAERVLMLRSETGPVRAVARELGLKIIEIEVDLAAPAGQFRLVDPAAQAGALAQVCAPGDVALVLHTSGTTARPKLVPLSQANLVASARNIAAHLALSPADCSLNVMPLFHIHGLVGALLASLASGGRVVCTPGFDEQQFFDWIAHFNPSWYSAVPTVHQAVLAHGELYRQKAPAHRFRFVRSSSAALPAATLRRLQALLQAPVVEAYGMTEASHQMASNPVQVGEQTAGSVGVAAGVQVAILSPSGGPMRPGEPGEIAICGPGVTRGYENNPQANAEAFHQGWFRTGDLGHLDSQGRLFISGRLKEIVNRGGEKVSPREVDDALLEHPDVLQAAAFGVPHPSLGEDLAAAVVRRVGSTVDEPALREFLLSRLAGFKVPSQIVLVHGIPAGATGKVQRSALHQALGASLTRAFVAPGSAQERAVELIFREVLECGPLGVHDNFFARGGDSLRGARVIARVNHQFGLKLAGVSLFRHPSVAELVHAMQWPDSESGDELPASPLLPRSPSAAAACSFSQEALWMVERLAASAGVYNSAQAVRISGALDVPALGRALEAVLQRHEVLRTGFDEVDGAPVQRVHAEATLTLVVVDARGTGLGGSEPTLKTHLGSEVRRPFDLAQPPLLRASLWRLDDSEGEPEHLLLLVVHHIVADGWSMRVLAHDLGLLYSAFSRGLATPFLPLPIQFADWAVWQRDRLQGEPLEADLRYWRERLTDLTPLAFPTDLPRPSQSSYAGGSEPFTLPAELIAKLRALARERNVTLFMLLLAAFKVLLMRYTHQDDVAVGSPVAGRDRPDLEGMVGYFVNSVVLRTDLSGNPSFVDLLDRVRQTALEAYQHQELPFERLVAELSPQRDLSRNPLYQVSFALNNQPATLYALEGVTARQMPLPTHTAKFDLSLTFNEPEGHRKGAELQGNFEYSTDLFERGTVQRLSSHMRNLLTGIAAEAVQRVAHLPLMSDPEWRHMASWNDTSQPTPTLMVHQQVEQQARHAPEAVAVAFGQHRLNYRQLNARANQLAHHLRRHGVGPEVMVTVCMERSLELVVAMLAVPKAGGALVPLDPELPTERLAFVLQDTSSPFTLTQSGLVSRLPQPVGGRARNMLCLDTQWHVVATESEDDPAGTTAPTQLAYVIYTSGSTGKPKGVLLEHGGWRNHAHWLQQVLHVVPHDRFLQISSISFDAAVVELFMPLQAGATLVVAAPGEHRDTAYLARLMQEQGITVLQMVPSALSSLLAEPLLRPGSLRCIVSGGEALDPRMANELQQRLPQATLGNFYGPTETTIHSTHFALSPPTSGAGGESTPTHAVPGGGIALAGRAGMASVPIGRPIANTQCFVLDRDLQPVPVGVMGELWIGGAGLARGYLDRPALTAERFIRHPSSGQRLYRSGDLARFRIDGNIEYLGRADFQVKIRGHRIELGEIEVALRGLPGVQQAVVVARGESNDTARLVAYVVAATDGPHNAAAGCADHGNELLQQLAASLPAVMVPSAIVLLPALPLLSNGKIDRKALPAPDLRAGAGPASPPHTPTERLIWELWRDVLKVAQFGVHDNFFELGGHSLLATRLMARLRDTLQVDLPLRVLFESPTVAALARRLPQQPGLSDASLYGAAIPIDTVPRLTAEQRLGLLPLSAAQQRMAFWHDLSPDTPLYNLPVVLDLQGPLNVTLLQDCLRALAQRHELLRTRWVNAQEQRWQQIDPHAGWQLRHQVLSGADAASTEACEHATAQEAYRGFDLNTELPLRALLIERGFLQQRLVLTLHHSVCDGESVNVLLDELCTLYTAAHDGQPAALAEPLLHYTDYAAWEPTALALGVRERERGYWQRCLADAPTSVELPTDYPHPAQPRHRGATLALAFTADQSLALQALAQRAGSTLFMVVLALWQTLLHRYSGQATVVTGTVCANRGRREFEAVVGCFANTLALRSDFHDGITVADLLAQTRATAIAAFDHARLPFDEVVDALKLPRDSRRMPLVQTFVVLQPPDAGERRLGDVQVRRVALASTVAKFDVSLELQLGGSALSGWIEYDTALFERATIQRMAGHLHTLADAMCANPGQRVATLPMLSDAERRLLLTDWNRTAQPWPLHLGVQTLVEQQAERSPRACAVIFGGEQLSYTELNASANRLAHHLRGLGVGQEVLVGVCMERSLQLAVALLAVLKAGGAFVPLDPELPPARLALMLHDTRAPVVLTQAPLLGLLTGSGTPGDVPRPHLLCLDAPDPALATALAAGNPHNPLCLTGPDSLAYVIYTSGSTGRPKGVMSLHRGLSNHILWLAQALAVTPADRLLQKTTISFDAAVWEFFTPWQAGATLVLARPGEQRDPEALVRTMRKHAISIVQFVPSALRTLLDEPALAACTALRHVVSGGEALDWDLARAFQARLPSATLGNFYGPSEASDDATHAVAGPHARPHAGANAEASDRGSDIGSVPIGRPITNVQCYVLDAHLQPLPIGATGELFIGGAGLARGYLGRPELTAERFIAHPFNAGERLYRTGDRVRWRADGQLGFVGRVDFQVKIRGQRVELGEIEAALNAQAGVHQAVVVVRDSAPGPARLVAYVVGVAGAAPDPVQMRAGLATLLPPSMLPEAFVVLAALPTLPNGKINRNALPAPHGAPGPTAPVSPRTPTEQAAWEIWRDLLRTDAFGVHDNFFDLGGQSLLAAQVMSRLRAALQVALPLQALFDAPTVAGLALRADAAAHDSSSPHVPITPRGHDRPVPLSAVQRSMWLTERVQGRRAAYHMPTAEQLTGRLDTAALERALAALVQRHDSLRLCVRVQDGTPLQRLNDSATLPLETIDLSTLPAAAQTQRLQTLLPAHADAPFDLARAPLARAVLVKLANEEHVLQLVLHHLVSDGWSAQLLRDDLAALYRAFAEGTEPPPHNAGPGYLDYAAWEAGRITSGALAPHTRYWTQRLHGLEPLNLPFGAGTAGGDRRADGADRAEGDRRSNPADATDPRIRLALPAHVVAGLAALARRGKATLFMVYLAAFKLLLMRWCDQTDIAVGTPIARRDRPELAHMVGPLLNTLVLRTDLAGEPSFEALLARVRETALQAYLHQEQPFDSLVAALNPVRVDGRNPLFDVLVNALPATQGDAPLAGLLSRPIELDAGAAKFALTLYIRSQIGAADFVLHYRGALFAPGPMAALMDQYGHLLAQIAAQPQAAITGYSLVTEPARALLADPRQPLRRTQPDTQGQTIFAAFCARAAERPDTLAATSVEGELSYGELERLSRGLGEWLVAQGIRPGDRVALHADRCLGLVVAVLGAARAGAVFSILDRSYPDERNLDCVAQLAPKLILVCGDHAWEGAGHGAPSLRIPARPHDLLQHLAQALQAQRLPAQPPERPRRAALPTVDPRAAAYVSFTSGTTGRPKGIVTAHAPLPHFVAWHAVQHSLVREDRFSMLSGLAHDPLLRDLFTPLSIGATLCIPAPPMLQQPDRLVAWLAAERVSVAHLTPALGDVIATACGAGQRLEPLRRLFWGGDRLTGRTVEHLRAVAPHAMQVNFYGTTETPQAMAHYAVPAGRAAHVQPVGRGIDAAQLLLLAPNGRQAGVGESAEIFVRSPYLALGYLDDDALTRARFVPNPLSTDPEDRLYRTGDLGRCDSQGNVLLLGRLDDQVNVRGLRVEPAEIERVAQQVPGVERAIVKPVQPALAVKPALTEDAVAEDADTHPTTLLLYYACRAGAEVPAAAVEAQIRQALPGPMWPRAIIRVAAFARLPNGKIDLRALPDAAPAQAPTVQAHDAPRGPAERAIAQVWQELLGVSRLSRADNFFDLGGHSLLAMRAAFMIEQRCGLRVDLRRLVHESLAQLAEPAPGAPGEVDPPRRAGLVSRILGGIGFGARR